MKYEIVFSKEGWSVGLLISRHEENGVPSKVMARYDLFGEESYYVAEYNTWYSSGIYITKNEWFDIAKSGTDPEDILKHYHIDIKKPHKFYPYIYKCLIKNEESCRTNDIAIRDMCSHLKKSKIHFIHNKLVEVISSVFEIIIDNISRGR